MDERPRLQSPGPKARRENVNEADGTLHGWTPRHVGELVVVGWVQATFSDFEIVMSNWESFTRQPRFPMARLWRDGVLRRSEM